MADLLELPETMVSVEGWVVRHAEYPINFETFLNISGANGGNYELINGVMIERMSAQLTHEWLFAWLYPIMVLYAKQRSLGRVLGSRTAVEINAYHGRLPDLLFVRQERLSIVRERAIYEAPDLVVEIVSPNDRPSDIIAVEADYRSLGVGEIVFIDMPKRRVRIVRLEGTEYSEEILTTGEWRSRALPGLNLQVSWLLDEPRPDELDTLQALLNTV